MYNIQYTIYSTNIEYMCHSAYGISYSNEGTAWKNNCYENDSTATVEIGIAIFVETVLCSVHVLTENVSDIGYSANNT